MLSGVGEALQCPCHFLATCIGEKKYCLHGLCEGHFFIFHLIMQCPPCMMMTLVPNTVYILGINKIN